MSNITGILKGRWTLWIVALCFSLLAGGGALSILGQAADRKPYYVLNQDVAQGMKISSDMLEARNTTADGVPADALTPTDFDQYELFSVVAMLKGTVLQRSMVTQQKQDTTANNPDGTMKIPPGFVLASIMVDPQNAVGGRVSKGDYIDIAAVGGDASSGGAKIVMQHVLVMDVTVAPNSIAEAAANRARASGVAVDGNTNLADQAALYSGTPSMYLLAVSPQDFVKLALISDKKVYFAISAEQVPSALDVMTDFGAILRSGPVGPSYPIAAASTPTPAATGSATSSSDALKAQLNAETKKSVEGFYQTFKSKGNYTFVVSNGSLQAVDSTTKKVVSQIGLGGGTFNVATGLWTAP